MAALIAFSSSPPLRAALMKNLNALNGKYEKKGN